MYLVPTLYDTVPLVRIYTGIIQKNIRYSQVNRRMSPLSGNLPQKEIKLQKSPRSKLMINIGREEELTRSAVLTPKPNKGDERRKWRVQLKYLTVLKL